jgi:hypothetical protein
MKHSEEERLIALRKAMQLEEWDQVEKLALQAIESGAVGLSKEMGMFVNAVNMRKTWQYSRSCNLCG